MLRRLNDGAVIDVDDDALHENGLLRDGHRMRVPMEFRGIAGGRRRRGRCALPTAAPMHRSDRGFITTADSEAVRRAAYHRPAPHVRTPYIPMIPLVAVRKHPGRVPEHDLDARQVAWQRATVRAALRCLRLLLGRRLGF
jgi:hypothetical protein